MRLPRYWIVPLKICLIEHHVILWTQHLLRLFSYRGLCPNISLSIHFFVHTLLPVQLCPHIGCPYIISRCNFRFVVSSLERKPTCFAFPYGSASISWRPSRSMRALCWADRALMSRRSEASDRFAIGPVGRMAHKRHIAAAVVMIEIFAVIEPLDRVSVLGRKRLFEEQFLKTY